MRRQTRMQSPISRRLTLGCLAALASISLASPALANDDFPNRPIRIMVGASPGGGTDIIARMLADKFSTELKQSVVVENRPGASQTIAADATANANADGY